MSLLVLLTNMYFYCQQFRKILSSTLVIGNISQVENPVKFHLYISYYTSNTDSFESKQTQEF